MNIKYRQLKAFSLAAQLSSFTEAADAMAVTPASFSNLIKELENDLGVVLFDRTTRRCNLTDTGRTFHDQMATALEHMESLYRQMAETGQGRRGRLTLAAIPSLSFSFIPAVLAAYREHFPDVQIVLRERKNDDVFAAVRQREVEVGMGSLLRPDPSLVFLPLFTDRALLVVPCGHALEAGRVSWRSLEAHPYILMSSGFAEHAIRAHHLHVRPAFEVENVATAVAMVRNGMGLTVLPSSVVPSLNMEGVSTLPIVGRQAIRTLGVAHRSGASLSKVAEHFIDMLRQATPSDAVGRAPRSAAAG